MVRAQSCRQNTEDKEYYLNNFSYYKFTSKRKIII